MTPMKTRRTRSRRGIRPWACRAAALLLALVPLSATPRAGDTESRQLVKAPRTWDDAMLADWAVPLAGLGEPPTYVTGEEYYRSPVDNLRTYPVYHPDREPPGYLDSLRRTGPRPLVERRSERTLAEWIEAGKRVFEQLDVPGFRTSDPEFLAQLRSPEALARAGVVPDEDGTIPGLRWVVTDDAVQLGVVDCAGCHTRRMPDGTRQHGAPFNERRNAIVDLHLQVGTMKFFEGDSFPTILYRMFGVPWVEPDIHDSLRTMTPAEVGELLASNPPGTFARANGSPFYTTKVPDLIGIADRHYLDHTGTHLHRGPGDIMRYAAAVSYADTLDFGGHRFYAPEQRRIRYHLPDELLFAMTQYIYSLEPPANPNPRDDRARAGEEIFHRERCANCHKPPLYTNNVLTPARGFEVPREHYGFLDIVNYSVGTDPSLATKTRKGTGYYKVPSLLGVWYRGLYLHDGSVASLEELFDRNRLRPDFVPGGFRGYRIERRAVTGHEFGLSLSDEERASLIAFLRTL